MKTVIVQISDADYARLLRDSKDSGWGTPLIGVVAVVIDGEMKIVSKETQ